MSQQVLMLIAAGALMFLVIGGLAALSHHYTLNGIKARTVGDGQHGTARWATDKEIKQTYAHVPFKVREWREGHNRPTEQGLVLGCKGKKGASKGAIISRKDLMFDPSRLCGSGLFVFFAKIYTSYCLLAGNKKQPDDCVSHRATVSSAVLFDFPDKKSPGETVG